MLHGRKNYWHEVNDLEIPSLQNTLFKALFVPSIFLTLISNSIFSDSQTKQFFYTTITDHSFITVNRSPYFMVKNRRKYGETVAVISSVIAMLESRWMQQVLYIPWILRINLFKFKFQLCDQISLSLSPSWRLQFIYYSKALLKFRFIKMSDSQRLEICLFILSDWSAQINFSLDKMFRVSKLYRKLGFFWMKI